MAKEIKFEVVKELCVISENNGWTREVNIVSWNGGKPKLDIRDWSEGREKCSKGLTFNYDEAQELKEYFANNEIDF